MPEHKKTSLSTLCYFMREKKRKNETVYKTEPAV